MDNYDHQQEIEVPPFFLCPISLQIMKDPITISTGITYDRESIETWVFINKNTTCPVTKQALNIDENNDTFLTPNHTLRRLIQSWCTLNASYGIERFPTPKPPITKSQILKLINDASSSSSQSVIKVVLEKIKGISLQSSGNKRCLESTPGLGEFLAEVMIKYGENQKCSNCISEEALSILVNLQMSNEMSLRKIVNENEGRFVDCLVKIMQKGSYESRAYAIEMMKQVLQVVDPVKVVSLKREHFEEIIQIVKDDISPKATKAALKVLALACPWGRNRIRVCEAGGVVVMVNELMECKDRRTSETILAVLDCVSGCAEGRAELLGHAGGLAVVSKKILRVSHFATEKGVKILYAISKFSGSPSVVQEMLQIGVVTKLCLVLQVDCEAKTKEKAREILKLHVRAWSNSPCAPAHVFHSFK
ncbi:E3 ubiquitin-protein ligase PUB23-like [Amaranthus tricolor]|uniref:E3 ubiquitin-protein ligase PUB23-like n=1 Tax=Amaranthus tricolor TaxID=29722 RepID=UPI002590B9B3|nr:E3 ubiquitin-protein ligase PUB23-like [Amaranthus tricolor]